MTGRDWFIQPQLRFASHRESAIEAVVVGGRVVVRHGRHALHASAAAAFVRARAALLARL